MKADGFQLPAGVKKAIAPAAAALSIAAPAFAEGTGEVTTFVSVCTFARQLALSRGPRRSAWSCSVSSLVFISVASKTSNGLSINGEERLGGARRHSESRGVKTARWAQAWREEMPDDGQLMIRSWVPCSTCSCLPLPQQAQLHRPEICSDFLSRSSLALAHACLHARARGSAGGERASYAGGTDVNHDAWRQLI